MLAGKVDPDGKLVKLPAIFEDLVQVARCPDVVLQLRPGNHHAVPAPVPWPNPCQRPAASGQRTPWGLASILKTLIVYEGFRLK